MFSPEKLKDSLEIPFPNINVYLTTHGTMLFIK